MKTIIYIDYKGDQKSVECQNFAIDAQHHDGCVLSFLGDKVEGETDGRRVIVHQAYGVKEWWLENAEEKTA